MAAAAKVQKEMVRSLAVGSQRRQVAEFPPPFEDPNRGNVIDKEYQMWDTDSRETDPSLTGLQRNVD